MNAWSSDPIPSWYIQKRTPLVLEGANVFQYKQCRNCHALGGVGGRRGPALDDIASRMTQDQLIRQVEQGGGNMPAFGANLSPPQITALVKFLETLHAPDRPLSGDAAHRVVQKNGIPKHSDIEQGAQY